MVMIDARSVIQEELSHIKQFGGDIFYVSELKGDDAFDGSSPHGKAKATIGAGFALLTPGDALVVMA